jgi:bifunctional DNA-binding transcriptional regulator/antitoxin component of YhaV-PrlF toxin-antitoxin module
MLMLLQTDTRRRITLPPNSGIKPGDTMELEVLDDGRILLTPVEAVPKHQLWAWTADSRQAIEASLADPRPSAVIETPVQAEKVAKRWADED